MQEGGEKKLVEPGYDAGLGIRHVLLAAQPDCQFFC